MEKPTCAGCTICCRHIAIELDKPDTFEEFTEIIWYLMHENVVVGIDHEDEWYIEFKTKCKALNKDNRCDIYELRPQICRDYDPEECERNGEGEVWKYCFTNREEFLKYLEKANPGMHKKILDTKSYKG